MSKHRLNVRVIFLLTFVCLTISLSISGQALNSNVTSQASIVSEFEVNGLKVLVKRRASAPTVAAGLFIRGGARNINAENAGIESFMLNVAAEATQKYPRETLRRELAGTGGGIGAGSNNDYSVLSLASTRANFDKTWDIFTDVIQNPTFERQDVERVRDGILTGLREQESNADNFLQILQDRIIYANHPYSNDVGGTIKTISKFSEKDLRDYHKRLFETSRLLLVVVGDIETDYLKEKVAAAFGNMQKGKYEEATFPPIDFSKPSVDVTTRSLPTNYIQGVFDAPSLGNPDYSAMRVAITFLQGRLFQEIRVQRQLSYAPNAELNTLSANTATVYVTAVEANKAVEIMLQEIDKLKNNPISSDVIANIGGHFLTLYYLDQQSNAAQGAELAKYELIGGGWENSFQFLNRVREVTAADIQAVSKKYMKNIRFVVVGNPRAVDRAVFLQN